MFALTKVILSDAKKRLKLSKTTGWCYQCFRKCSQEPIFKPAAQCLCSRKKKLLIAFGVESKNIYKACTGHKLRVLGFILEQVFIHEDFVIGHIIYLQLDVKIMEYLIPLQFDSFSLHALNLSKVGVSCFIFLPGRATRRD